MPNAKITIGIQETDPYSFEKSPLQSAHPDGVPFDEGWGEYIVHVPPRNPNTPFTLVGMLSDGTVSYPGAKYKWTWAERINTPNFAESRQVGLARAVSDDIDLDDNVNGRTFVLTLELISNEVLIEAHAIVVKFDNFADTYVTNADCGKVLVLDNTSRRFIDNTDMTNDFRVRFVSKGDSIKTIFCPNGIMGYDNYIIDPDSLNQLGEKPITFKIQLLEDGESVELMYDVNYGYMRVVDRGFSRHGSLGFVTCATSTSVTLTPGMTNPFPINDQSVTSSPWPLGPDTHPVGCFRTTYNELGDVTNARFSSKKAGMYLIQFELNLGPSVPGLYHLVFSLNNSGMDRHNVRSTFFCHVDETGINRHKVSMVAQMQNLNGQSYSINVTNYSDNAITLSDSSVIQIVKLAEVYPWLVDNPQS